MNKELNVKVDNISKKYVYYTTRKIFFKDKNYVNAISNISFEIEKGEILGIVGPNGSGKTTIVKIVSGIISKDNGVVSINGEDPFLRSKAYRQNVGIFLGQKNRLNSDTSTLEFSNVYGSMYKLSKKESENRLYQLADMLNLGRDKLLKPVRNLSLGERMKSELCITFLNYPLVCFLDEPTIGLDFQSQKSIRAFLKKYVHQRNASIILTSHDMEDINQSCEKILLINKGKSLYYGCKDKIINKFEDSVRISFYCNIEEYKLHQNKCDLIDNNKVVINKDNINILTTSKDKDEIINYLYKNLTIKDLNVSNISFEEMIARIFKNES